MALKCLQTCVFSHLVFPDFVLLGLFVVCVSIIFLFFLFLFFVPVVVAGSLSGSVAVVLWPFCAIFQEVLRQCFPDALQSDPTLQRLPESIQATLEEDPATKRWLQNLLTILNYR